MASETFWPLWDTSSLRRNTQQWSRAFQGGAAGFMSIPTTGRPEALTDFDTLYPNTFIRLIITINLQKINTTPLRRVPWLCS